MTTKIKAVQTEYNGYRFRSRLEARWAIFFDNAKIKYQYEIEGFELTDGTRYLPDFYLPKQNIYVEVKGLHEKADDDIQRCKRFVSNEYITKLLFLSDIPGDTGEVGGIWHFPGFYFDNRTDSVDRIWFYFCDWVDGITVSASKAKYKLPDEKEMLTPISDALLADRDEEWNQYSREDNQGVFDCFYKARGARFEHGEKGGFNYR